MDNYTDDSKTSNCKELQADKIRHKQHEERCISLSGKLLDSLFADESIKDYVILAARFFAIQQYGEELLILKDSDDDVALLLARTEGQRYENYNILSGLMKAKRGNLGFASVVTPVINILNNAYTDELGGYSFLHQVKTVATSFEDCRTNNPEAAFPILLANQMPQASTSQEELIATKEPLKQFSKSVSPLSLRYFNNMASLCYGDHKVYTFLSNKEKPVLEAFMREFCLVSACEIEKKMRRKEEEESNKLKNRVKSFVFDTGAAIGLWPHRSVSQLQIAMPALSSKPAIISQSATIKEIGEGEVEASQIHVLVSRPSEVVEGEGVAHALDCGDSIKDAKAESRKQLNTLDLLHN
jgi:hypothetical protein